MPPKKRPKYVLDRFIVVPFLRELNRKGEPIAEHRATELVFFNPAQVSDYMLKEWEDRLAEIEVTDGT